MCDLDDIQTTFTGLIVDCDGCPSLSVEPSGIDIETATEMDCTYQDWDYENLFEALLNAGKTAIKTIT